MKTKYFSKEWWEKFLISNQNFSKTIVIKDVIDDQLTENLNLGVLEVLKERFRLNEVTNGFRVYIEGVEQREEFNKTLCETLPHLKNKNITEYCEKVFNQKFGIIINGGERHSEYIANNIYNAISPLMEIYGLPVTGIECTIFIGNYGWTPLGIHQDHRGENVIHFHLGPGKKTMYIWDEKEYEILCDGSVIDNNQNIKPLLKESHEFPFEKGDIYYMPWNKYHVGYSEELSVGITIWLNNPTKMFFVKKITESLITQHLVEESNKEVIPSEQDFLNNMNSYDSLISSIKSSDDVLNSSMKDFYKVLYKDFKYSLLSNGGWNSLPLLCSEKDNYDVNNYNSLSDKKIRLTNFKILYTSNDDVLFIYVRGIKLEMKFHEELINIINEINTNKELVVKDLIFNLSKEWPAEVGLYFLSEIYNYRGIVILPQPIDYAQIKH